jgi:ATP-dependent exoDNAse (exonuclease V) beta subunit
MSARPPETDAAARRLIREAIDTTLVVEAAAGTGKTTELVNRILRVIAEGRAHVREIVAVTFTEKAAGELKLRLRQGLEEERARAGDVGVRARLEDAVQSLEEAHVSTIHGFCADLLRERPVEARIDPLFRVLTETQAERLFGEAFGQWFQVRLEDPPEGVRRSLRRASRTVRPGDTDDDGPMERLRRAGYELAQWRDFRAPWARVPFDRAAAAARVVALVHTVAELSANASYKGDNLAVDTEPIRRVSRSLRAPGAAAPLDDLDGLEALLAELRRNRDVKRARKGSGPTYAKGVPRARVLEARDELFLALNDFCDRADADLAAALQAELLACVDGYEALKQREGALDFLDLLLKARDLVRDDAGVRAHFQARFKRIFVDEFQDTDPLQAELLLLLAARDAREARWRHVDPVPGKLFIVGDPKQSIYRFRRADVGVYQEVCDGLVAGGAQRIELRTSFRGVPNIQRAVNAAFAAAMDGDAGAMQARYIALDAHRQDEPGQPSVVALPVPEPYGQRYVSAMKIEQSLPDAVGAYVDWLVRQSGWTVTERRAPGERVPIAARHVCILFRRFVSFGEDVTRPYVEALEARGVRHLLVGGKAFHDREEIETLRAALMAIEWPDDQLSVFATLRGALFAISDEDLLEYHYRCGLEQRRGDGRFHPFRIPASLPDGLQPIAEALQLLARLHKRRNFVPVAETIAALIRETRAHVGLVLRPGGEQALANVLHVAELARQYELDGGMSFRGFVDALQEAAGTGQAAEAPILEEGSDGVRLMTVHKAKGLEFPVVILADITARLTPFDAGRWVDTASGMCALRVGGWSPRELADHREQELARERAEGIRVAYVAATRARDLLVVPAVGDGPYEEGWVAPLNPVLYPPADRLREQHAAPGCPPFTTRDSVLVRPDGDPATSRTVCPGLHAHGGDVAHEVVWWSPEPALLPLGARASLGLRRDDLIVKDVPLAVLTDYRQRYDTWRAERAAAAAAAARPTVRVMTVSEAAEADDVPPFDDIAVETVDVASGVGRKWDGVGEGDVGSGFSRKTGGVRFGTLVHALLADVPLEAGAAGTLDQLARAHGRLLGADPEEVADAAALVTGVLASPVLQDAAAAASRAACHRETPVTLRLDSGAIVEGVVDLAYDDGGGFVVVDFKTDRELEGNLERYSRQVRIYAAAIRAATGRPVRAMLVRL